MHPERTTKVKTIINEYWKAGENKDLGNVKISADGVFSRLEEMQMIELSCHYQGKIVLCTLHMSRNSGIGV